MRGQRADGALVVLPRYEAVSAAVLFLGALGLVTPALCSVMRRKKDPAFEYGDLDITKMTAKAAKELHTAGRQRTSLIPDALQDLEESAAALASGALAPSEEVDVRAKALAAVGAPPFRKFLKDAGVQDFERDTCHTLQVSIGLYCNQACTHCHVESSPLRKEMMSEEVVQRCLHLLRNSPSVNTLDITGGAPELNSGFRPLVEGAAAIRDSGDRPMLRIIDRCNLTVLLEPGQEDLVDFLVRHRVEVVASLPSYDAAQTDRQRGRKVFERSVEALQMLNARGYGHGGAAAPKDSSLRLDLVFNPPGPFLPPRQEPLEEKYRSLLREAHSVEFNQLITIANMPVKRFFDFLRKKGTLEGYMDLLVRNFNPETVPLLMCKNHINVGWDGRLYDCDFNQQLELTLGRRPGLSVFDVDSLDDERLRKAAIATAAHCFGCTAAQGSS